MIANRGLWRKGPSQSIECGPPHDRPIFCLAVGESSFVTGSADHGLRQYKLDTGKQVRQLFNKKYGHKEWVSTCAITPDGHVISGAMDSVVCYWDPKAVRCDTFLGHKGSISKVAASERIGVSAGYDASIKLWDLKNKSVAAELIGPHQEPVMEFEWKNRLIVSGDKAGIVAIWDLTTGQLVRATRAHKGAVSTIKFSEKHGIIFCTGLNDGTLTAFDMRSNKPIERQQLHRGSANSLLVVQSRDIVATCSADRTIQLLTLPDFQKIATIDTQGMVFCLEETDGVLFAGTAKGNVLAYDLATQECLYGYGAMQKGACRLLSFNRTKNRLVCAGEDEKAVMLAF